jgi:O-antigen ligase
VSALGGAAQRTAHGWARRVSPSALIWALLAVVLAAAGGYGVAANHYVPLNIVLVGLSAAAIVTGRYWALLLLVLVLPSESSFVFYLAVAGGAVALAVVARDLPAKRVAMPWIAFVVLALASTPWVPSWDEAPGPRIISGTSTSYLPDLSTEASTWLLLALALVLFLLASQFVRSVQRLQLLVGVFLAGSMWPILVGIQQKFTPSYKPAQADAAVLNPRSGYHAVQSVFQHPNPFGFYLVLVLVVALVALFEVRNGWLRAGAVIVLATGGFCLLSTYTRSAWVGFAVAVLLLGIWRYRLLIVLGIVLLPFAGWAAPGAVRQVSKRFGDLTSKSEANVNNSWTWRKEEWGKMWHWGSEQPLAGQGWNGFQRLTLVQFGLQDPKFKTYTSGHDALGFTAHNDFVKTFVELGFPGLLLWIAVLLGLVSAMVAAARAPGLGPWAAAVGCVLVVTIAMSYSDNIQAGYSVVFFSLLATLAGAVAGTHFAVRSENRPAR